MRELVPKLSGLAGSTHNRAVAVLSPSDISRRKVTRLTNTHIPRERDVRAVQGAALQSSPAAEMSSPGQPTEPQHRATPLRAIVDIVRRMVLPGRSPTAAPHPDDGAIATPTAMQMSVPRPYRSPLHPPPPPPASRASSRPRRLLYDAPRGGSSPLALGLEATSRSDTSHEGITPPTVLFASRRGPPLWVEAPTVTALAAYLVGDSDMGIAPVDGVGSVLPVAQLALLAYTYNRSDVIGELS